MTSGTDPNQLAFQPIPYGQVPKPIEEGQEGGGMLRYFVPLAVSTDFTLELVPEVAQSVMETGQSVYIDNRGSDNPLYVTMRGSRQVIQIPPRAQGYLPVLMNGDPTFIFNRLDAGVLPFFYMNMPMPAIVWSVNASGTIVTISGTVAISAADGAIVNLGAAADAAVTNPATPATLLAYVKGALTNWVTLLARIPALGQALMAASFPVTIASNQSALATTVADAANVTQGALADAAVTNPASAASVIATLKGALSQWAAYLALFPAALGQGTMAQSLRVVLPSDMSTLNVSQDGGATGTQASVNFTAASMTVDTATAGRKGAVFFNASANVAYLLLSAAAASATAYTYQVPAYGTVEIPFNYRGEIRVFTGVAAGSYSYTELS